MVMVIASSFPILLAFLSYSTFSLTPLESVRPSILWFFPLVLYVCSERGIKGGLNSTRDDDNTLNRQQGRRRDLTYKVKDRYVRTHIVLMVHVVVVYHRV